MATVTLHEYVASIEALLHEEAYERAISLCQYGLRTYPRCVDFYRLLGQACLETNRPDDAADMFRRVLGVDPQNFVARVGLGVVAEGIGAVDEALWQWERALELEPNHAAVRDEWQQLRSRRDNTPPGGRVKLNRAALGYIYLRGEQYERAAGEFRTVLAGIPADADGKHERFDLQVALAEALYRGGRQREAGELCRQVLKILPNALKPNLILGDIDLETGRDDEGHLLFGHAQGLDPENFLASHLLHPPVRLPKRDITVPQPDSGTIFPTMSEPLASQDSRRQEQADTSDSDEQLTADDEGLPDWLRTLRVHRANVIPARVERFEADRAPEWLQEKAGANLYQPPVASDVASLAPLEAPPVHIEAHEAPAQEPVTPPAAPEADLPDWLHQLRQPGLVESSAPVESEALVDKTPDWLIQLQQNVDAAPEPPTAAAPQSSLRAPEPAVAPIPDWLAELRQIGTTPPESELRQAETPVAVDTTATPSIPAAAEAGQILETKQEASPALDPEKPQVAAARSSEEAASPLVSTIVPEILVPLISDVGAPHAAAALAANLAVPHVATTDPVLAGPINVEVSAPPATMPPVETAGEAQAEIQSPHSIAIESTAIPDIDNRSPLTALPAEPEPPVMTAPPAHVTREVTTFLDDSSAPASIESQVAPTGAAEFQARLDLARVMKDIDLESSLELYGLMGGASDALRAQAIADVANLATHHPEAIAVLQHLRAAESAQHVEPESLSPVPSDVIPPAATSEAAPAAPGLELSESAHQPAPLSVDPAASEMPANATLENEGTSYLDDASAPASIETQVAPTGAAQYAARLELARMLVDLDLDTALDQYELMVGAAPALFQQSIADLMTLSVSHAEVERTRTVLALLQSSLPQSPSHTDSAPLLAIQDQEAPPVGLEIGSRALSEVPAILSETSATPVTMDAASAAVEPVATLPAVPMVSEEAMEPGAIVEGGQALAPATPVVDSSLADTDTNKRAPREAVDYLADSAAPASVESHAAPTGAAGYRARLDLARAVKFIDIDEALEMYGQLADADERVRQAALSDLRALLPAHPRAEAVIARLLGSQLPAVSHVMPEPSVPEWLADAQTPAPSDALVPPAEPVVAEEAMEEELVAPLVVAPEVRPVQPAPASAATPESTGAAPIAPVIEETAALPARDTLAAPHETIAAAPVAPVVEETAALPLHDTPVKARHEPPTTSPVAPISEAVATTPPQDSPVAHASIAIAPDEPVLGQSSSAPSHELSAAPHEAAEAAKTSEPIATSLETLMTSRERDLMPPTDPVIEAPSPLPSHESSIAPHEGATVMVEASAPAAAIHEALVTPHESATLATVEPVLEETGTLQVQEKSGVAHDSVVEVPAKQAVSEPAQPGISAPATMDESIAAIPGESATATVSQRAHEALVAAVAPEGILATEVGQQVAESKSASAPRETPSMPAAISAAPSSPAEPQARLERARALREISLQESAAQYQSLIDGGLLLPEIISDLQTLVQAQPGARPMRMLLAEALALAGRHQEAVEHYRKLV